MVSGHCPRSWVLLAIPARLCAPWAVAACLTFLSGCSTPATPAAVSAPAHLVVSNLTDYRWHIAINRASGQPAQDFQMEPRSTQSVDLAGADYVIEQSAQTAGLTQDLARRISVHLDPGQAYGWRLVTLLSEPEANTRQ